MFTLYSSINFPVISDINLKKNITIRFDATRANLIVILTTDKEYNGLCDSQMT